MHVQAPSVTTILLPNPKYFSFLYLICMVAWWSRINYFFWIVKVLGASTGIFLRLGGGKDFAKLEFCFSDVGHFGDLPSTDYVSHCLCVVSIESRPCILQSFFLNVRACMCVCPHTILVSPYFITLKAPLTAFACKALMTAVIQHGTWRQLT